MFPVKQNINQHCIKETHMRRLRWPPKQSPSRRWLYTGGPHAPSTPKKRILTQGSQTFTDRNQHPKQ